MHTRGKRHVFDADTVHTYRVHVDELRFQWDDKKEMRDHYDFSNMKGRKNPYGRYLKRSVTIRLDQDTVADFKSMAEESGIPYQSLINWYLRDCAVHHRRLHMEWKR